MTYVDTTITPEAGYTYVNNRQIYDVVAGAMTTHPAWDFVEYVDAINGANTYRRYVWKCNAAQSGLTADFFVVFQTVFVTATGAVLGWSTATQVRVWMGETYSAGVLGKFATNNASVTPASDLTNPATFPLATYAVPASIVDWNSIFGTASIVTSWRFWCLAAKDSLIISRSGDGSGSPGTNNLLCVGAYDSILGAADPLPIAVVGTNRSSSPFYGGGATRCPTMTAGVAATDVYLVSCSVVPGSGQPIGHANNWASYNQVTNTGTLGSPASTSWYKNIGGPFVSRLTLYPGFTASVSTKGVFRGYLKYVYGATLATHAYGDTFLVDGRVMVGLDSSSSTIVDTEAV